jgi:hypothetical protein
MPEISRFLKQDKKHEEFENLELEWIPHHNPDLVIFNDDGVSEKERIDLTRHSYKSLLNLLVEKGFRKKS